MNEQSPRNMHPNLQAAVDLLNSRAAIGGLKYAGGNSDLDALDNVAQALAENCDQLLCTLQIQRDMNSLIADKVLLTKVVKWFMANTECTAPLPEEIQAGMALIAREEHSAKEGGSA